MGTDPGCRPEGSGCASFGGVAHVLAIAEARPSDNTGGVQDGTDSVIAVVTCPLARHESSRDFFC